VHVVWNETTEPLTSWHTWSVDGGESWTRPERVPGFRELSAPTSLLADATGALYLGGLSQASDGKPTLFLSTWDGERWLAYEALDLDMESLEPGVAASLAVAQDRLDVILRGEGETEESASQVQLWHTGRQLGETATMPESAVEPQATVIMPMTSTPAATSSSVIVLEVEPLSTAEPEPTARPTETRTAAPTATPSPTPAFDATPSEPSVDSGPIPLPLLLGGGLAALIVVAVLVWRFAWWGRRR
jgi:hypothetical protein